MKRGFFLVFATFLAMTAGAQGIVTASNFFKGVSDYYATLKDYEVSMDIEAGKSSMTCQMSFKSPNLLRMDFSKPKEQTIVFNGDMLTIYLPKSGAILEQAIAQDSSSKANLAAGQGLQLLSRYYTVAYETGPSAEPLDKNSKENVIKLILTRKSNLESFVSIKLAINPNTKLIRRLQATTGKDESFIFDYFDYKLNAGISDQRFLYDAPTNANNFSNFLFSD